MALQTVQLTKHIYCCAFSADHSLLAVAPHTAEIHVYKLCETNSRDILSWQFVSTLTAHTQLVSGLDWQCPKNLLVSVSHDRTAFVWHSHTQQHKPPSESSASSNPCITWDRDIVITRLSKAALCVKWSPCGKKFAFGSSAKSVGVCFYDAPHKWWVCKAIKKCHDSSVVAIAWHPDSSLLATASTDGKFKVFSAVVKEVGEEQLPAFGEMVWECSSAGSWVHDVCWSPNGKELLATSHTGDLFQLQATSVGALENSQGKVVCKLPCLPLKTLLYVTDVLAVGGGWDGCLAVLRKDHSCGSWQLTSLQGASTSAKSTSKEFEATSFKTMDDKLATARVAQPAHLGCITGLHILRPQPPDAATRVATSALDGRLVIWDLGFFGAI